MTGGPRWNVLLPLAVAVGCGDDPAVPEPEPAPVSVAIEPAHVPLGEINTSVYLEWVAYNAQGQRLTRRGVKWTSSDPLVARLESVVVESTSYDVVRVTSQGPGTATITATWQGTIATAAIDVINVGRARLTAPDTLRALGDTARVDVLHSSGRTIPGEYFDWATHDESVLVVDSTGLMTAVGNGSARVAISLWDTEKANHVVVTVAQLATSLSAVMVADTLRALGDTLRLNAEARDANGHPVPADLLSWSSADDSVVTMVRPGVVAAVGNGTTEVFVASRRDTASASLTVEQRAVGVRVLPSADTLRALRDTLRLGVERFDANGHALAETPPSVVWSSSDESVATVDAWGLVTAVAEGDVEITASLTEAGFVATTSIRVLFLGERDVLAAFYHSMGGPRWLRNENWLTDAALDTWHGVDTDAEGRVIRLDLGSLNGLSGSIPPELGYLDELRVLNLSFNQLTGAIPRQIGRLANLKSLNLRSNRLTGAIPAQLGALSNLEDLNLANNALEAIPAELGGLGNLRTLDISFNKLAGELPQELSGLTELRELILYENQLAGSLPPELGGLANLVVLDLGQNRLMDEIPRELGNLANLRTLNFGGRPGYNKLSGSIPPELGRLSNLTRLGLRSLGLTGEIPPELANLINLRVLSLDGNELTGSIPAWLGDLSGLRHLFLSSNHLSGPIPPELGMLAGLEKLYLWGNRLDGSVPEALANLTNLGELLLSGNPRLTGPLPPALGSLPGLWSLIVARTGLSGPIPREFVDLRLRRFEWSDSKLCAPLEAAFQAWIETIRDRLDGPPCFTDALAALYETSGGAGWTSATNWLTDAPLSEWHGVTADADGRVTALELRGNGLVGTVPPEVGGLRDLTRLDLRDNALGGELPAELGELGEVSQLHLSGNQLEGRLPAEFGSLSRLTTLDVAENSFTGALPGSLTKLTELAEFQWEESGLCASPAAWFQEWLGTIANHAGGPSCSSLLRLSVPSAHVNQAAQNLEGTVPLIAGRTGLVRVFATADQPNEQRPGARATFFMNGSEVHRAEMEFSSERGIPEDAVSGEPDQYFRARIPGDVVVPGVEMVVEFDPDSTVPRAPGSVVRYPRQGRAALDVREMPLWELTVVPVLAASDPDSTVLDWVAGMGPGHPAIEYVRNVLPVGEHAVRLREPFVRSRTPLVNVFDWSFFAREIRLLRAIEAGTGTYYGVIGGRLGGIGGVGSPPVAVGKTRLKTMAHELGHTMGLGHSPCGLNFVTDPLYPYSDGSIGVWGYDARGDSLVPPATADVMGYCGDRPNWISDYYFHQALRYRLETESVAPQVVARETPAEPGRHLLLWGGASLEGELRLDPAFILDMPAQLPAHPGPYRLEGFGGGGEPEFSLDFAMDDITHGGGTFLFAIPYEEEWHESLQRIVLTGPEGRVELSEDAQDPVALVLDRQAGRLRSVLRGEDAVAASAALAADASGPDFTGADTRVLVSYGLPGMTPDPRE